MHVRELVVAFQERHRGDVAHLGPLDGHDAGGTSEVDRVDDHQRVGGLEELLDQVDAADADVEHVDAVRDRIGREPVGDDDAEAVVAPEDIADARDDDPHVGEDRSMPVETGAVDELRARLARFPAERYPVHHATVQYQLGIALTNAGRGGEAEAALADAVALFEPEGLEAERATALNALGAAHRVAGRPELAAEAFERAAATFLALGQAREQGAALFNLGLAERERGRAEVAAEAFGHARTLLEPNAPAFAAAAARELGATLLATGELDRAVSELERALALAERTEGRAELGAAANTLGLVHLAAGRTDEAIHAFRSAAGAHPRSVRPADHAMAKANLALAHAQAVDEPRARLAARQALAVPNAPEPVLSQAAALVERLGDDSGDLVRVLDDEPREQREAVVREELVRWTAVSPEVRRGEAAAWIEGQLANQSRSLDLTEPLLGGLLELPPAETEVVIRSMLEALRTATPGDAMLLRTTIRSAMTRFHMPQAMRLEEMFARLAAESGTEW